MRVCLTVKSNKKLVLSARLSANCCQTPVWLSIALLKTNKFLVHLTLDKFTVLIHFPFRFYVHSDCASPVT